jgi:integrase
MDSLNGQMYLLAPEQLASVIAICEQTLKAALCLLDAVGGGSDVTRGRGKGFSLVKRENKKAGFLYYVRYRHEGKMLPSKWNTHTSNETLARHFAVENRDSIINAYLSKKSRADLYGVLSSYYEKDSPYLAVDGNRNRSLGEQRRLYYHNSIVKSFIPFLRNKGIREFSQIKPSTIAEYQDALLAEGNKPQTINNKLSGLSLLFGHLVMKDKIKDNPFSRAGKLTVTKKNVKPRGCYEVEKLKGVFNGQWDSERSFFLCLLIYTTGLRNSEIFRIKGSDLKIIGGCNFIDVLESKTKYGVRLVPLHRFVYDKIVKYIKDEHLGSDDLVFAGKKNDFRKANIALGARLDVDKTGLKRKNITFYSGRHFWKTMMNGGELGADVEEFFMGHSVSSDVSKSYNHRDKQGKERFLIKSRQVFSILDKIIF